MFALYFHFENYNVISKHQHGFLGRKSTTTNLLEFLGDLTNLVDAGNCMDALYIDLEKAFDSVSHSKLLVKLGRVGVGGRLHTWISEFLCNRLQCIKVGNSVSECRPVISGIPQGTLLGPLLFILFINDVHLQVSHCSMKLYADDSKIYGCVSSFDDYLRMYKDIKCIEGWLSAWQLRINLSKCEVLHVGWNNLGFSYRIHNDLVSEPGYCKDLGVYISENLSTTKHCSLISRRAYYRMRQFFRTFTLRDRDFCIFLYCTYIRPLVESNTTIFYPSLIQDIDCVERVQRRFTKGLPGVSHLGYLERLRILGLDSLEVRRIHHDLILLFKIINNLIDIPFSCMFSYNLNPTRGHCLKLNTPSFRLNCRKNFFSVRICKLWNNLPERIVIINSLKVFKQEIIKVDFTSYCKGRAYTA